MSVSFVAVQFFYRYICLFDAKKARNFDGRKRSIVWITLTFLPGFLYSIAGGLSSLPDEYTDDYMRNAIFENYGLDVSSLPSYVMLPYTFDGSLRWKHLWVLIGSSTYICVNYSIILYCGLKMHFNLKKELKKFSVANAKLQEQFFKALVIQCLGPTVCLIVPAGPIMFTPLLAPYLGMNINWQTGWLYSLVGVYPPFDSIAFMVIVKEYRTFIRNWFFGKPVQPISGIVLDSQLTLPS